MSSPKTVAKTDPKIDPQTGTNTGAPPTGREKLLARAVDFLTDRGLSDLSLRDLAAALGTSHRMLIYHFGSKEGLFVEVVRETERRYQVVLAGLLEDSSGALVDVTRRFWRALRAPELAPYERLFFEVYGQAMRGAPYAQSLVEDGVESWIAVTLEVLERAGLSADDARAEARLGVAVARGLLLDVLTSGDEAGVEAAFERYLTKSMSSLS